VVNTIIKGHYRLVAGLVGSMIRSRKKADDAMGAALLALTQAVYDAETALYDNKITYYITRCVRYAIKEANARERVMRVPSRTIRHRLAQGERFEDLVPGDCLTVVDYEPGMYGMVNLPYVIPIAKPACESPEFKEAITRAATTPMEQAIIKLRAEGYGYAEIGVKVGYSTARVGQIMPVIEERFRLYYEA
jgi:hypothetical protein